MVDTYIKLAACTNTQLENNEKMLTFMYAAGGSPTVAKSRTPYLKSYLKSLKSLKFRNLKSRNVGTVISEFLYISALDLVKIGRIMSRKIL